MVPTPDRSRWSRIAAEAALSILALSLAFPAFAESPTKGMGVQFDRGPLNESTIPGRQAVATPTWSASPDGLFYRGHLIPKMDQQLQKLAPIDLGKVPGQALSAHMLFEEYTKATQRGVEHATKRAIRDFVLEETALSRAVSVFRHGKGSEDASADPSREVALGVGISGGSPEVVMQYDLESGSLRARLGTGGSAGLEFKHHRLTRTHVVARYDARRQEYALRCRIAF